MYPGGNIIRVTPTLVIGSPTAFGDGDVLLNLTEIPNATSSRGGLSRLHNISITNYDAESVVMQILFFQTNAGGDLGTENAQVSISDANFRANKPLGWWETNNGDWFDIGSSADSSAMIYSGTANDNDPTISYFAAIAQDTPTFAATNDLEFCFHIEYLS